MNNKMISMLKKHTVCSLRLNKKLSRILEEGVVFENSCCFLKFFYQENLQYSLANFEDNTAYECFINGFHIEDYSENNVVKYSFAFASKLAKKLQGKCKFKIIVSFTNPNSCHITYHTHHENEAEWVVTEQLDSCSECIAILM